MVGSRGRPEDLGSGQPPGPHMTGRTAWTIGIQANRPGVVGPVSGHGGLGTSQWPSSRSAPAKKPTQQGGYVETKQPTYPPARGPLCWPLC
jgi:hypothetical protein